MNNNRRSVLNLLRQLWLCIEPRRRLQLGFLLVLMIFASLLEILSIGTVLPFIGALTAPERIFNLPYAQPLIRALMLSEASQLLLPLTVIFCMATVAAGSVRLSLLWASSRLSFAIGSDLSLEIYKRTLYQPYAIHCSRNSSEVINGISYKVNSVIDIINMLLALISSMVVIAGILFALLTVDPLIALVAFGGFGLIYMIIIYLTRHRLSRNSSHIAYESTNVIKSLQEGLGGIRDIIIDGSQMVYCQIYAKADLLLRRAQAGNSFISGSPRYVIEALGILLIAVFAFSLAKQAGGIEGALPVLGAFVLGAQRLLPVLQQAYGAWSGIRGSQNSMKDVLELLDQPLPKYVNSVSTYSPLVFQESINLKEVNYRYDKNSPYVLKNLNLKILKGSRIGFIGSTGAGKSTLLDVLMGLLEPTAGVLEIDNTIIGDRNRRFWQAHIAHVPQNIFLADLTIEENIAFGVPRDKIDIYRVRKAAEQAQIADSIESWPQKYLTLVGEHGVRLSGGQRQRIGIARALYKEADVIIFDEATSALDSETELTVMQAIEALGKNLTILIIAHRLSTLKNCSHIVKLSAGEVEKIGTYEQLVKIV